MTVFLAGLVLGAAGSAHCVLMCGPLVGVIGAQRSPRGRVQAFAAYHGGRGAVYLALAIAAGLVGRVFWLAGLGSVLSVCCGVLMLAAAAPGRLMPRPMSSAVMRPLTRASRRVRAIAQRQPTIGRVLAGMLNGLLPCGMTYAAALTASALQDVPAAALFMGGFWAGTLPALAAVSLAAVGLPARSAGRLRWLAPVSLGIVGVTLIVRGLVPVAGPGPQGAPAGGHHHLSASVAAR